MGCDDGITPVGGELLGAIREIAEALRSGEPLDGRFEVRTLVAEARPRDFGPDDVRRVRESIGLDRDRFADFLGASPTAVRSWERGSRKPPAMARRFMEEIESAAGHFRGRATADTRPATGPAGEGR